MYRQLFDVLELLDSKKSQEKQGVVKIYKYFVKF